VLHAAAPLRFTHGVKTRLLVAASLFARAIFMVVYRLDSDEPQHLHVVWGWSRGLVQYRDLFDNHFPLLHLLFVPLMRLMPESSATFFLMRLAIAPFAIACGWLLYRIGRPLIGERRAVIAAVVFSVMPPWLAKSVEFRNDTLWIFFWLAALALVFGRERPAWLWAGAAAALCLLASVKALPLLLAHALALASQRQSYPARPALRVACGAAVPLLAAALFLYLRGALDEMVYATLLFNASLPVQAGRRIAGALAFVAIAPALASRGRRSDHLTLVAIWFPVLLLCFWPSITPRDFLPLVPLAALAVATIRMPVLIWTAALVASICDARLWRPADLSRAKFVDAAVAVTAPDDYVFDLKGDAVFRRRPVFYIYDIVGRALTGNGTLPDRGPEEIVASRCCVAMPDLDHIPPRTRSFLNAHFVTHGVLRVCGTVARDGAFTIAVPQTYAVIAPDPSRVVIDGVPYRGPRFLAAGRHTAQEEEGSGRLVRSSACSQCGRDVRTPRGSGDIRIIWWRAAH